MALWSCWKACRMRFFDEIVEFVIDGSERKIGRIVELYEDKAVIQVFEGTENMSLTNTHTKLTGHPMEIALSPDMLGRTFNGIGQPIDDLGPIVSTLKRDVNGLPLNPVCREYPRKLYSHRNLRHRRTDHPDPGTEAADLFRQRSAPRSAGCPDCKTGVSGGRPR